MRKEKGIKQAEMVKLLDCRVNHYQKTEYGQVNIPSLTLEFLADCFKVSADYLPGRSDVRKSQ